MTTETTPATREELEALVTSATTELTTAQSTAAALAAEIMGKTPIDFIALGKASEPVEAATRKLSAAKERLASFIRDSAWESSAELRQPIMDAIHTVLTSGKVTVPVTRVFGNIVLERKPVLNEDGTVNTEAAPVNVATPKLTIEYAKLDADALGALLVDGLNVDALMEQEVTSLTLDVSKMDGAAEVTLKPTATVKASAANIRTTGERKEQSRAGVLEYFYNGEWLGTRAFIDAVGANDPTAKSKHSGSAVWDDPKANGASNLAKTLAKELNIESRVK